MVQQAEVAAFWSDPIRGASGHILGAFAICHCEPHNPSLANPAMM
ncbi:hypothetical protein LJR289_005481 [Pseudoduganella sp. LjRoot289]